MKDYGLVRALEKPEPKVIDDYSVWLSNDIKVVSVDHEGEIHHEYEFRLLQYDKNEYIRLMDEKNEKLEKNLTDTQLALCDVYELIGGV